MDVGNPRRLAGVFFTLAALLLVSCSAQSPAGTSGQLSAGKSLGCYRYSADLFGIPSGNANSPATIDAVQEPGSSTLEEQCSALCFKEGYPFSAARRNAALENGAENPLLCLCGHDIDMPYLGGTCPQNDRTVISVYLHAPDLQGDVVWASGHPSNLSCYSIMIYSQRFNFMWYQNSPAFLHSFSTGAGNVHSVTPQPSDTASYACTVRYQLPTRTSRALTSGEASVTVLDPPTVNIVEPADQILRTLGGLTVDFRCSVTGPGVLHTRWDRVRRGEVHRQHHYRAGSDFQLHNISSADEGRYTCVGHREGLHLGVHDAMDLLVVDPPLIHTTPVATAIAILSRKLVLNCSVVVDADLGPVNVRWTKIDTVCPMGTPLALRLTSPPTAVPQSRDPMVQSLAREFAAVEESDAGQYACTASTVLLTGCVPHQVVDVVVVEPLRLTTRLSQRVADRNVTKEVVLHCAIETAISGKAPGHRTEVRWLKDGLDLRMSSSARHVIEIMDSGRTAKIAHPLLVDTGSYRCLARYSAMSNTQENWFASEPMALLVEDPPVVSISAGTHITKPLSSDITVVCRLSGGGLNTTLMWYRSLATVNMTLSSAAMGEKSLVLNLPNVNVRDEGTYFCSAFDPNISTYSKRRSTAFVVLDVDENATSIEAGSSDGVNDEANSSSGLNRNLLLLVGVFAGLFVLSIFIIICLLVSRRRSSRDEDQSTKGVRSPQFSPAHLTSPTSHGSSLRYLPVVLRNVLTRRSARSKRKAVDIEKSPVQRRGSSSGGASPQRRRGSQQSPRRSTSMVYGNTDGAANTSHHSKAFALLSKRQNYEVPMDEKFYDSIRVASSDRARLSSTALAEVSSLDAQARRLSDFSKRSRVTLLARASMAPSEIYDDTVMMKNGTVSTPKDPTQVYDDVVLAQKGTLGHGIEWQSVDSFLSVTPDSTLRPSSPDYVHMNTILSPSVMANIDREYWPENLVLPPTPDIDSFLASATPTLPGDEVKSGESTPPGSHPDSDSALNVPAWLKEEVESNSGRTSRSSRHKTPTPIGVRLLSQGRAERDDGRTYDIAEATEGHRKLSMESGEYDIPDHDTDNQLDGTTARQNRMPAGVLAGGDYRPKQPTPVGGETVDSKESEAKKKWPRLSLRRSPSKKSTSSTRAPSGEPSEIAREASKTLGSLTWLIHSAAGLLTRKKPSRPANELNAATDSATIASRAQGQDDDWHRQRRKSDGGDSYDLPFNNSEYQPSTLPKSASKKSYGFSPTHYYNKLKFNLDQDAGAAIAAAAAARSAPSSPPPQLGVTAADVDDSVYTEPFQGEKYQAPPSSEAAIYQTLNNRRYRHIHPDHVRIRQEIGSGRFGLVYHGSWTDGDRCVDVAVKTLRKDIEKKDRVLFLQEAAITGQFKHKNIVQLHGVVAHEETILLVFELMTGNLRLYLNKIMPPPGSPPGVDTQRRLRRMCMDVASGMMYLTERGFVHRDLAARNVMLDDLSNCKVGDFGMSRILDESDYYVCQGGMIPVKWSAPEAINYRQFSSASDVWSFGILMYEIWTFGEKPYGSWTNEKVMKELKEGYRLDSPSHCPYEMYCLMAACWEEDKHERPTFRQISHLLMEIDEVVRDRERVVHG